MMRVAVVRRLSILVEGVGRLRGWGWSGLLLLHHVGRVVLVLGDRPCGRSSLLHEASLHQLLWHLASQVHHAESHAHGGWGCGGRVLHVHHLRVLVVACDQRL